MSDPTNSNIPGATYQVDLYRGGTMILSGRDQIELTLVDENGDGGSVTLNLTAAEQVSNALKARVLLAEGKGRSWE